MSVLKFMRDNHALWLHDTRAAAKALYRGKLAEQHWLEHVYHLSLKGLAVDVGAHVGAHSLWFAAMCDMEVFAFEPVHAEELRTNVSLNWLEGSVRVEDAALGENVGWARRTPNGRVETVVLASQAVPTEATIAVRKLDDYDLRPSLVKIDAAGAEGYVLRGGQRTLRVHKPLLYVELAPGNESMVDRIVKPWGYGMTATFLERGSTIGEWRPT